MPFHIGSVGGLKFPRLEFLNGFLHGPGDGQASDVAARKEGRGHDVGVGREDEPAIFDADRRAVVERAAAEALFAAPRHHYTAGLLRSVPSYGEGTAIADRKRLVEIPGMVPSLFELPEGCKFADRCPAAGNIMPLRDFLRHPAGRQVEHHRSLLLLQHVIDGDRHRRLFAEGLPLVRHQGEPVAVRIESETELRLIGLVKPLTPAPFFAAEVTSVRGGIAVREEEGKPVAVNGTTETAQRLLVGWDGSLFTTANLEPGGKATLAPVRLLSLGNALSAGQVVTVRRIAFALGRLAKRRSGVLNPVVWCRRPVRKRFFLALFEKPPYWRPIPGVRTLPGEHFVYGDLTHAP